MIQLVREIGLMVLFYRNDIMKKNTNSIFRSPAVKGDEFMNKYYEESKESHHFPDIIDIEKQEEIANQIIESVPHKLPDLSNKYRKLLKESSSDEFEPKYKVLHERPEMHNEYNHKLKALKESEMAHKYM